jgi:hypothetical protein
MDARLSKAFRMHGRHLEGLVEAFNVANRANWTLVVVRLRPSREADGLVGKFVERLFDEFGAGQAMVHPDRLPTPFGEATASP